MPQNTNAQGKGYHPVKSINYGEVLNNQIKYWRKYEDDEKAKKLIAEAREREFKRKLNKDADGYLKPLKDVDAKGYFIHNVQEYKDANLPKWTELSKLSANGDDNAKIKLSLELDRFTHITNGSQVVKEQSDKLLKQLEDNTFNQWRDGDLLKTQQAMAEGRYSLDPKLGKFRIYSKNGQKVISEFDPQELSSKYLKQNFHKAPTFVENADDIAKNLLDNIDGEKKIDPNVTPLRAVQQITNYFAENENDRISFYNKAKQQGLIKNLKPLSEFNSTDVNTLSKAFYKDFVEERVLISTKDTTTEDEKNRLDIIAKKQAISNARKEGKLKSKKLKNLNEAGNTISLAKTVAGDIQVDNKLVTVTSDASTFLLPEIIKDGNNSYDRVIIDNGEFILGGEKTTKLSDVEASNQGLKKGAEVNEVTFNNNKEVIDRVIKQTKNGKGKINSKGESQGKFNSKKELFDYAQQLLGSDKTEERTETSPKKKLTTSEIIENIRRRNNVNK